ncbi:MAG: type transport system permease protein [Thermotogaceae bacterium]|nr:type transport system permease protein [Thermotogaceae bacterium]
MSNKKFKQFYSVFIAFTKDSLRNKIETFFSILFPILFFVLFGFIFGGNQDYSGEKIGFFISENVPENIKEQILKNDAWVGVNYDSFDLLKKSVENSDILLGVKLTDSEIEFIYYSSGPSRDSRIQMMRTTIAVFLRKVLNNVEDVMSIKKIPVKTGKIASNQMSYLTAGVLAISLLSSGMFSMITLFGSYKRRAILKRIISSPVNRTTFIVGSTLTKLLISFISVLAVIIVGFLLFNLRYSFNWPLFLLVIISSAFGMMALGILLLILFKKPEAAQTAGSILMTLMVFFSGVYFPVEFLPKSLRIVSFFLPVKYVAQSFRYTAGIEYMNFGLFIAINLLFLIAGIILISVTGKLFLKEN